MYNLLGKYRLASSMEASVDQMSDKKSKIRLNDDGSLELDWEYDHKREVKNYKLLAKILPKRKKDGISISAIILGFILQALEKSPSVVMLDGQRWIHLKPSILASVAEVSVKAANKHAKKLFNEKYIVKRERMPGKKGKSFWYSIDTRIEGLLDHSG